MRRLGKKGQTWMTEETGKIFLSIAVIFVLFLFVWKIISIFMANTEYEQAKAVMSEIKSISESISKGDTRSYLVESPKAWAFMNYPNKTRLCYCPRYYRADPSTPKQLAKKFIFGTPTDEDQKNICNSRGVCLEPEINVLGVCNPSLGSGVNQVGCLYVGSVPYEIKITKDFRGNLQISSFVDSSSGSSSNLPPTPVETSSSNYKTSILALNEDIKFQELIRNYLISNSDFNKQAVINHVSSLDFVKAANSEGKIWKIQFANSSGTIYRLTIYPTGISSSDYLYGGLSDQADLNKMTVGDTNYKLEFQIYFKDLKEPI